MNIFGVKRNFGYFCGNYKATLGVISIHFMALPQGQGIDWEYVLGVAKISSIFWGMPDIPDTFWG